MVTVLPVNAKVPVVLPMFTADALAPIFNMPSESSEELLTPSNVRVLLKVADGGRPIAARGINIQGMCPCCPGAGRGCRKVHGAGAVQSQRTARRCF